MQPLTYHEVGYVSCLCHATTNDMLLYTIGLKCPLKKKKNLCCLVKTLVLLKVNQLFWQHFSVQQVISYTFWEKKYRPNFASWARHIGSPSSFVRSLGNMKNCICWLLKRAKRNVLSFIKLIWGVLRTNYLMWRFKMQHFQNCILIGLTTKHFMIHSNTAKWKSC